MLRNKLTKCFHVDCIIDKFADEKNNNVTGNILDEQLLPVDVFAIGEQEMSFHKQKLILVFFKIFNLMSTFPVIPRLCILWIKDNK